MRQYQRGVLSPTGGFGNNGGGSITTPISLPNTDLSRTYDLDSLGNWRRTAFTPEGGSPETEIRQHNGLNEITRIQNGGSQTNLTYDGAPGHSNGNLANDGTRTYQWDALNRLLQVHRVSDGAIVGQYVYDALNRRIRKTVSNGGLSGTITNGTTDCLYSGWRSIEERNPFGGGGSTDTPTAQYIWGIYLDECLQQRLLIDQNNFAANSDLYPLQDLLYRTTGLADSSGVVREAYDTDAYGNTLIFRNSGTPPAAIAWTDSDTQVSFPTCPFIFTGQRFDAETLLDYYKQRYYIAALGRFAGMDRSPHAAHLERFGLANSNPTKYLDPSGNVSILCHCKCYNHWGHDEERAVAWNCAGVAEHCCEAACANSAMTKEGRAIMWAGGMPPWRQNRVTKARHIEDCFVAALKASGPLTFWQGVALATCAGLCA